MHFTLSPSTYPSESVNLDLRLVLSAQEPYFSALSTLFHPCTSLSFVAPPRIFLWEVLDWTSFFYLMDLSSQALKKGLLEPPKRQMLA